MVCGEGMIAACIVALGIMGAPPPSDGAAAPDGAAEVADGEQRFTRALADLKARRFHQAAQGFEALWVEGRSTRVLSFAAQAREGAGHWAHAIEHMRTLLAAEPEMNPKLRARLTARRMAARRHTLPVLIRLQADGGLPTGGRLTLRRVAPDEVRPLLVTEGEDGRVVDVDPGVWSLTVEVPGYRPRQKVVAFPRRSGRADPPAEEVVFPLERILVDTTLAIEPAAAVAAGAQWTLTLEQSEAGGGGLRMIGGAQAVERLSLVPGRWRARLEAVGYEAQEITWVAGEGDPPPVTLVALPPPPAPPSDLDAQPRERDPGKPLAIGLGAAGGLSLAVGVGLLASHRKTYADFTVAPDNAAFVRALTASAVGSGMVGAGLGLAIAAATAGLPVRKAGADGLTNGGLWIELGVGGGVALIGAAWYAREWPRVQRDLYGAAGGDPQADQRRETAAAAFIGAGVGLMAGAGVALLTRHLVARKSRVTLGNGPGLVGLGLRGRF